ncbi:TIGR02302 family protein [Methylobacterium nonmethylotrophicum]|uniref:TIGR02302 family protein n=1 Tax=Methylobacterium nonmethylotrophicum TaxID=1141884 RepID=A0A4Z0NWG9_9HYPH|nr:TIGR02302 family protein [Methylobacterium nonmethylotrophicum]TGE01828.1 TIGR02302 family protein [Methylobacterium nonmethylotrophicum]
MTKAEPDTAQRSPASDHRPDPVRAGLDRLVVRAGRVTLWEQAWPILWRGLAVVLLFLAASWLGLWLDAGPALRMAGVAAFGIALLAALAPLVRLRRLARTQALARIDRDAGLSHRPARALEDTLALGRDDPGAQALWALHRRRAAATVARLKVSGPRPGMTRRDPFALRAGAILAAVAGAFVAGPEAGDRLRAAFDWRGPPAAAPAFRVDGWIDPPLYTRMPPLIVTLAEAGQRLRAPVNATLVVRIAGASDATVTPGAGLKALPATTPARPDLREERFTLTGGTAEVAVQTGFASTHRLTVETIPDRPPEIAFAGAPETNGRGTFTLAYRAKDDYGLASAEGLVEPQAKGRSLVPPPRLTLSLPTDPQGNTDTRTLIDLTDNPWAGAKVLLTLVARDEAGQEGRSAPLAFTLPGRFFTKPLARSLAEERRRLVLDPDGSRARVETSLDALLIAPERFTPQWGVFLGLKEAARRLRAARTDEALTEVADLLWTMALQIEEGDLSDAEKALRAAQDRLKDALDRGASDQEIAKLTDELRQAMDRFLKEFAQRQQQNPPNPGQQNQQADRTVTPDDLSKMLDQMQEAMKRGDVAEAQRLLDQLRGILENLQTAQPNSRMSDPTAREMNRQMQDLEAMAREQQGLRDETFRQGQERRFGNRGQPQQGQQGQRQPGQRGQQGQRGGEPQGQDGQQPGQRGQQGGQPGGLGDRQQALRQRLEDLQRRMKELGMQGEQGLSDAEQAMREAENALGQGQDGSAVDAQGRALEGLQRGAQGMAQQMQQMGQDGEGQQAADGQQGQGNPNQPGRQGARDNDPLGRPTRSRDFSDGRVRVPTAEESGVERARRILEELRRKLGDPSRPAEELDYFERLLRRN